MRQFIRGERAKLSELAAINHLWNVEVFIDAPFWVVDFSCLGLDAHGEVFAPAFVVNYNHPEAPRGAIRLDNASNNGAIFSLDLGELPAQVRRVVFTATLSSGGAPGGILGLALPLFGLHDNIGKGHFHFDTPAYEIGSFAFTGEDFGKSDTLILGEFYFRDEWRFVAAGQPLPGELGAFLRTLGDGPTPFVAPARAPQPSLAAPPRAPRPIQAPIIKPPAPIQRPISPRAPISPPIPPPAPTSQLARIAPASIIAPPIIAKSQIDASQFPQELQPGETLQNLIDKTATGATLILMGDEYAGPFTISKPLTLEGRGSALWARVGPVVTIAAPNVKLRDLDIEVTIAPENAVALLVKGAGLQLENVRVSGQISGLGAEDGAWKLPDALKLGDFAARVENEFVFEVSVPTRVELSSPVAGISISPLQIEAGTHQITLRVRDVAPDALLVGLVELRSSSLLRSISLSGNAVAGIAPARGVNL